MTDTLAAIASTLRSEADALRIVSQNIANAESVAYRREIPVSHLEYSEIAAPLDSSAAQSVPVARSAVDIRPGTLQSTGEPLDLAIEGSGFFVVSTANGEVLTRRGDFRLDASGQLVTQNADPVLGTAGPIQIGGGQPSISVDGTVRSGDDIVGRLRLVEIPADSRLEATANGAYRVSDGELIEGSASRVQQGFLETSNVESVTEMIRLMESMRRFEAAQRFVRGYDSMIDQAISTLGKV